MSDVNKLDNKQCPFDPEQYKIDTLAAPVGTSPWALIQVYLGNKVHRKDWSAPDEYIYIVSGSGNDAPEIKKRDKHGMMTSWQPTQEDLIACDWGLVKIGSKSICPESTMLSFGLTLGAGHIDVIGQAWGYMTAEGHDHSGDAIFGTLTNFQSNIDITNIISFIFYREFISLKVSSNTDDSQKMIDFLTKPLYVSVDKKTYILHFISDGNATGSYIYRVGYGDNDDTKELGEILKQTGQTKNFCFSWK